MDCGTEILLHIFIARRILPFFARATGAHCSVQPKLHYPRFYWWQFHHLMTANTLTLHTKQTGPRTVAYFGSAGNDHIWLLAASADAWSARFSPRWPSQPC